MTYTCIEDLRRSHERRVPRMFYDYVDSGSWTETTYRDNEAAFAKIKLRQRVARDISSRSIKSKLIGRSAAMPVALAPTGLTGMQHADGEILAAKAAEKFGVPFTLSTMSICSIESVAAQVNEPFWFQLYVMKDFDFIKSLIERARPHCDALVVTVDLHILGQRHKDIKNGLSTPPAPTPRNLLNMMTKLRWAKGMLGTSNRDFGNVIGHAKGVENMRTLGQWSAEQLDPSLNWDDVARLRELWGGKFIVKGVMEPEDARAAVNCGADAILVSNHGGRQLDGAPATIDVLPAIVAEVGSDTEVWMDGGIRSGQDVFKALALGATGTMIGRAFLYGLGADGEAGVSRCLEIIANELDLTMAFCGLTDINDVDDSVIWQPAPA